MRCSFCAAPVPEAGLAVFGFALCPACSARLIRQDPRRREYDWFVGWVRRGLTEPLLSGRPG